MVRITSVLCCAMLLVGACARPDARSRSGTEADAAGGSAALIALGVVAAETGLETAALEVLTVEARDFPDSSLGCPVSGRSYLQVITPGHRVQVRAPERIYDVRVAGTGGRICELRGTGSRSTGGSEPGQRR